MRRRKLAGPVLVTVLLCLWFLGQGAAEVMAYGTAVKFL